MDTLAAAHSTILECPTTKALIEIAGVGTERDAVALDVCVFANTMAYVDDGTSLSPSPSPPLSISLFCHNMNDGFVHRHSRVMDGRGESHTGVAGDT